MRFLKVWLRKAFLITFVLCGASIIIVSVVKYVDNYHNYPNHNLVQNSTFQNTVKLKHEQEDDKIRLRRFPYLTDTVCKNFSLSLYRENSLDPAGLISYPGSGNTWTRHLIQLATGVYTGSFYFDIELFAGGFLGEKEDWYSGGTIVQKFHEKYNPKMNIEKAILLIREPFPAILSFANYIEGGHTGNAFRLPFHQRDWQGFLLHSAYDWLSLGKSWIESPVKILVIHYERLRLQPVKYLRDICNFLNHTCSYLGSECFQKKLEGSFRRRQTIPSRILKQSARFANYPDDIEVIISRGADHLNGLLKRFRHEPLPLQLYKHYKSEPRAKS